MRSEAIEVLGIGEGLTEEEAQKLANFYSQLDEKERYQPFCVAILYSLRAYFGIEL